MFCRVTDMRDKEVINIKTGCKLGYVCDVEIDTCTAKVLAIVIWGRLRFFGLFGRCEDIIIPWCDIKVIGEDTILVCFEPPPSRFRKKTKGILKLLFGKE